VLDGVTQRGAWHDRDVLLQESFEWFEPDPLAHFPKHSANCLMNQIMLIGQENFCQGQGVASLASIDEGKCGDYRDAPVPNSARPCQLEKYFAVFF
jgi:hypothetical protein